MEEYLKPTFVIDSDNPVVREKAKSLSQGKKTDIDKAISFFRFVREINYSYYTYSYSREFMRASATLARGQGFCAHKAIVLAAFCRASGIPARLGYAIIRNHLAPEKIIKEMNLGSDLFVTHSYNELYLEGKWIKAAAVFDSKMCQEHGFMVMDFDGRNDVLLPTHNVKGKPHVEYIEVRGLYADFPMELYNKWREDAYGPKYFERLNGAIAAKTTGY